MRPMNLHQSQSHEVLRSWQSQRADVNHHKDFVLPLFVGNSDDSIEAIDSMPGVNRYGSNRAIEYLEPLVNKFGLRAILLFPVVTKGDQAKLEALSGDDDSCDEDAQKADLSSSSVEDSSVTLSSSPESHSSGDSSSTSDDERAGEISVKPERLIPEDEPVELHAGPAGTAQNSQNPFLNQNEEEEDHLLVEDINDRLEDNQLSKAEDQARAVEKARKLAGVDRMKRQGASLKGKESRAEKIKSSGSSKSRDVRLIRGLALKDENNPVLRLIPRLRTKFPELLIICDVCLCTFTSTGHCCLFDEQEPMTTGHTGGDGGGLLEASTPVSAKVCSTGHRAQAPVSNSQYPISNKITCQYLALLALEYARRGCNVVAPSDMMDGRIQTIREKLNENQLHHVSILSYSAKFASAFYGPFRQATLNAPEFGDRCAYQLPPGSRALAMRAAERDIKQGADFVMVKPASPYLDIVRDLSQAHPNVPIAVYQVSGEYSMLRLAADFKILDLKKALNEVLTAYRRAGATIIISYFTPEILRGEL